MRSRSMIRMLALAVVLGAGSVGVSWAAAAQKDKKPAAAPAEQPAPPAAPAADKADADFDQFGGEFEKKGEQSKPVFDPLRGYNRAMYHFNDKFYFWAAKPAAQFYGIVLPEPLRVAIRRGYTNMGFPVRFVALGLQGRFSKVGSETGRFLVNSTLGVGGLLDPAEAWLDMKPTKADFGQTFGKWGLGDGFPITLPFLGPSNLRDFVGLVPGSLLSPPYYIVEWDISVPITAGGYFNDISLRLGEYEKLKLDALDPYTLIRDTYKQNRDARIKE
ncbi:MAG: VacJ family lipoprotein [Elusimicrobia bacterium]|nr:VacJ family lipoprotein [Elusimicrobiota bacterium]